MRDALHRFGKFYSKVILNYIGIFIFVGMLSVIFGDNGWFPNENIYAISQFIYEAVIPTMIAYTAGNQMQKAQEENQGGLHAGGTIAVMATAGIIIASPHNGILGAMVLGPLCGLLWEKLLKRVMNHVKAGLEMLLRNIIVAFSGGIMAILAYYLFAPVLSLWMNLLMLGINYLIDRNLICFLSVIIEPAKVFFLNNSINHGVLVPLGMQQAQELGGSLLFLLESNPGPGLGVLLALYIKQKKRRKEYAASIFVHFIGGIHEIYFPSVLANLWLLIALICGGAIGDLTFSLLKAATVGVVSPGSIISVLMVSAQGKMFVILAGVLISVTVSMLISILILNIQDNIRRRGKNNEEDIIEEGKQEVEKGTNQPKNQWGRKKMLKIGFVCDAGVGSSAMGAALFRRKLSEYQLLEAEVKAYAIDQIPEDITYIICQEDFYRLRLSAIRAKNVYTVHNLLNQTEYGTIIEEIRRKAGENL